MENYKDTLNLPTTAFPMKANLAEREPAILQRWQALNIYQRLRENARGKQRFVLHDGPPYANARPHLGTALNKILKDIVVKSKTLGDLDAPYVPGWDCHGLPVELNVEKKVGKVGEKLSAAEFRKACRDYAKQQVDLQCEDFQRLGVIADWAHPYLTMNAKYEANIIRALAEIYKNGYLKPGYKPVYWCTACGSSLAEAEVEYQDKTSQAIDVAFDVVNRESVHKIFNVKSSLERLIVPIWTTTPWTLPANQAVAVNPHFEYVWVQCVWREQAVALICAKELLAATLQRYEITDYKELAAVPGRLLEGLQLQHPFNGLNVPVILGDHVTAEAGTGAVHTAPDHGQDDYVVGQRYNLQPSGNFVNPNGTFDVNLPGGLGGVHVFKANDLIIEWLKQNKKLLHHSAIQHSYPHCWRHKIPLIFRATRQWFIIMDRQESIDISNGDANLPSLREQTLEAAEKTAWIPESGKKRISNMIVNRPDWCVSRQRLWGVPIPLFLRKSDRFPHKNSFHLMQQVADLVEKCGLDAWYDLDPAALLGKEADEYEKVTDILDVWFEAGVSHYCVAEEHAELGKFPADLYLEGSDQHRGWFQSSLLTSVAMHREAPYKTVLTHGYVVDGQGRKMSKSLGNVIVPADIAKSLGADVLRLWVAASDYKLDINYSEEILKRSVDAYRRIRNTARFLLANIFDFDPAQDLVPPEHLLALDRWAITETAALQKEIITAYDDYSFQIIYQKIHNFCSVQMGSFYLDIIKDRQYTSYRTSIARRSAQTAIYHIIEALTRWLAPIASFTAEEIWPYIPGKRPDSPFLSTWYNQFPAFKVSAEIDWPLLISVRDAVNKVLERHRLEGGIGSALEAEIILYADEPLFSKLSYLGEELRFVLITSAAEVKSLAECTLSTSTERTELPNLRINVIRSAAQKCERCWQYRADVGKQAEHPTLCGRCVANMTAPGETRHFA